MLKQDAAQNIFLNLKKVGFQEKVSIPQEDLDQAEEIISRNVGGSLFQENLILHIKHTSGKFPEKIKSLLGDERLFQSSNIALIIESSIEKIPVNGAWIKNLDKHGLIIDCQKLKLVEEKMWLKRQLSFLPENLLPLFGGSIFQNHEANLIGQKNEVSMLKLLFLNQDEARESPRASYFLAAPIFSWCCLGSLPAPNSLEIARIHVQSLAPRQTRFRSPVYLVLAGCHLFR